ncbi:hypothetical protein N431DRAFT_393715 [Stipitochalara longipes BDJ]|nr:hypothetical protein N431DRAFT_393715 [Stipitochalara longipes BDJ]
MFSIIVPENTEPATRRSHKKSRGGCKTCKERKLKCDEIKPTCGNCQRRFISTQPCDYSHLTRASGATPPTLVPRTGERGSGESAEESDGSSIQFDNDSDGNIGLPASLSAELLDPFRTHPETRVPGINVLLKHYLGTAVYKSFPWQPASDTNPTTAFFVPLVWRDEVLFHATLQFSAARMDSEIVKNCGVNTALLSAECIRLLRDRVENSEEGGGLKDETISAVATLAAVEHQKGNLRMLRMHMNGLSHMVSLRGGLNAIRLTSPMTANWVFWMFTVTSPHIPFPALDPILPPFFPSEHNLTLPTSHFSDIGPPSPSPPPLDVTSLGLAEPMASIMTSVQHVSQLVPRHDAYPTAETSSVVLARMCTLLSHLLSLPPITVPSGGERGVEALITETARFAILIHVFTPWRGLPPDGTVAINCILHQLMASLRSITTVARNDMNNALVLWMFAVGGVASSGMPERTWFVNHLAEMVEDMGISSWEEWKDSVSRCIWHERLYVRAYEKLWGEILKKREEIGVME